MSRIPPNNINDRTKHHGAIRISRVSGGGGEHMCIHLTDKLTGIALMEIEIGMEAFAYALTGYANLPVQYELRGAEHVGKVEEYKSFRVPIKQPHGDDERRKAVERLAEPHCIDGWMYCGPSTTNNGSWSQGDWQPFENKMGKGPNLSDYTVLLRFVRYVEKAPVELQPATPVKRVRVRRPDQQ